MSVKLCRMTVALEKGDERTLYGKQPELAAELERLGDGWVSARMTNSQTGRTFLAQRTIKVNWVPTTKKVAI